MVRSIQKQLGVIESSIEWIRDSLGGNKAKDAYSKIIQFRRRLKGIQFALSGNPAAAVYGESQVGKSYLISSILSEKGRAFSIIGENDVSHNFIEEINPPGGGSESTSLVSRFSVHFKSINSNFPIKATLLSIPDIILVLCDSFYNDLNLKNSDSFRFPSSDEINSEIAQLKTEIELRPPQQEYITEDDILEMRDYFQEHFQKADKVFDSNFFHETSSFISKTRTSEWPRLFSVLWGKNDVFTNYFSQLLFELEKLSFVCEILLPIEAVLYAKGTILDVKRLREIYSQPDRIEPNFVENTKVYLPDFNREVEFKKSFLCALVAEIVFSLPSSLTKEKDFLSHIDLLDFPGARARMDIPIEKVEKSTTPGLLLRGKVAYLFNKYSSSEKINVLIFCAKHEQAAQRVMPRLLNSWINRVIGETPEKREHFISKSGISPLFVVGTFFNINLSFNPQQDKLDGSGTPLSNRWHQRFVVTLETEYFEKSNYTWFENWTVSNQDFDNIYLLRDFEKSETPSHLYSGYNQHKFEQYEVSTPLYPNFKSDLRQSFLDFTFVTRHFSDPQKAWDEAALINKDGTEYIIKNLLIASRNIALAFREKKLSEINETSKSICLELSKYYHSSDKNEKLQNAKNLAGDIQFKLATEFSGENISAFGQLMKEFILDESVVLEHIQTKVDSIEYRDVVNLDLYSNYRIEVPVEVNDTPESYFQRLCERYEKNTDERKDEFRELLNEKQIDLTRLISGNSDLIRNNSSQIAEALINFWFEYVRLDDKKSIQRVFGKDGTLDHLLDLYKKIFRKVNLSKRIAEKIRRYVDNSNNSNISFEIVADISAEIFNSCVLSFGFYFLDDAEFSDLKLANEQNNLGLILGLFGKQGDDSLELLFSRIHSWSDIIQTNPEQLQSLPNYRCYLDWSNRLKIAFISVCDIPNYDVIANEKLGTILAKCTLVEN